MIRRPPRSTLFPSRRSSDLDEIINRLHRLASDIEPLVAVPPALRHPVREAAVRVRPLPPFSCLQTEIAVGAQQDRKSTRLNSSHLVISYAVFCLKKKNRLPT